MNLLRLISLLSICCFLGAAREIPTIPAHHPEQIGGRREMVTPSGVEGLGFEIFSQSNGGPSDGEHFVLQQVNVLVYTREAGKEKGGYFSAQYRPKRETELLRYPTSFEVFDGRHLRIHFTDTIDVEPFDLDIAFLPKANKWIGTWSRDGKDERVTLVRPEAHSGAEPNKFVGKWIGQPSPNTADESTTLNIRQSADGVLSASLDQAFCGSQRNGDQLNIESISDSAIVLSTNFSSAGRSQFNGSLSADGQTLYRKWGRPGDCCGELTTVEQFQRAPISTSKSSSR
jgi:hypothetical protein